MIARICIGMATVVLATFGAVAEEHCGGPERPCMAGGGAYFVAQPEHGDPARVVIYLHGYGASGAKIVGNAGFVEQFTARGYMLIVPNGQPDTAPGSKGKRDWGVRDGFDWQRDDIAFLRAVIADVADRFDARPDRFLMMGYSRGGSMAWDMACLAPDTARAFAAYAGGFWEPMNGGCQAPVNLHHAHGFRDRTVPLEGRPLVFLGIPFEMGDVFKGLRIWTALNGCSQHARETSTKGPFWVKSWTDCEAGSVTLALGPGGHGRPKEWVGLVLDWFEALPAEDAG